MRKRFSVGGMPFRQMAVGILTLLVGLLLQGCGSGGETFGVGAAAPDFTLQSATSGEVSLADYTNKQPVLLFFHMAGG